MTILTLVLATAGALLTLIAAIGLFRLPDAASRLHAATKASSLGTALMLTAVVVALPSVDVGVKALLAVAFQLLTAPIAAHLIGRASHRTGLLTNLVVDESDGERHPGPATDPSHAADGRAADPRDPR